MESIGNWKKFVFYFRGELFVVNVKILKSKEAAFSGSLF